MFQFYSALFEFIASLLKNITTFYCLKFQSSQLHRKDIGDEKNRMYTKMSCKGLDKNEFHFFLVFFPFLESTVGSSTQ